MEIEDYRKISISAGLPLQFVIKELAMFDLLSKLIDKIDYPLVGGTAINRIYLNELGRFSEDLDFEVYGKRKLMLSEINGFKSSGPFIYRRNLRFEFGFQSPLGKDKIRLDFNMKPNTDIHTERKTMRFFSGAAISGVSTFSLERLIAGKVLAMRSRTEGKDVYDVWASRSMINKSKLVHEIKNVLQIEKIKENTYDFMNNISDKIKKTDVREFKKANPFIPADKRIDWKIAASDVAEFLDNL